MFEHVFLLSLALWKIPRNTLPFNRQNSCRKSSDREIHPECLCENGGKWVTDVYLRVRATESSGLASKQELCVLLESVNVVVQDRHTSNCYINDRLSMYQAFYIYS